METLERLYPAIRWREPIRIVRTDGLERWACRICIGAYGLSGMDIDKLYGSPTEVVEHIEQFHPESS